MRTTGIILARNQFFILLFIVIIPPFLIIKIIWLAKSKETKSVTSFVGHDDIGSALGMSTYAIISFKAGNDTVLLRSSLALNLRNGETISVRYQKNNPADAVVNNFFNIWAGTIAYGLFPALILLVLYIMPERMEPVIPRKSKILIGKKPLIKIIPA
jgi:hypothetical protein